MTKRILVVSGSRADQGLLAWPTKVLREDGAFDVKELRTHGLGFAEFFTGLEAKLKEFPQDLVILLGDRYEILAAATACHLQRVPIAHICGGDITEGSYDDAMRDAISRMATFHFVTSTSAMARLTHMGYRNVHLVGNPGIDYIRHADWKRERPYAEPYVVVSYQAETIDSDFDVWPIGSPKNAVVIRPNLDSGSDMINREIDSRDWLAVHDSLPHDQFLNLIFHCEEFIGNSSAMLYEAPELGVKCRMIGKRQRGRTIPWGDGNASERIAKILKYSSW